MTAMASERNFFASKLLLLEAFGYTFEGVANCKDGKFNGIVLMFQQLLGGPWFCFYRIGPPEPLP